MNIRDFESILKNAKSNSSVIDALPHDPPATNSDIEKAQELLSVELPVEYKEFVKQYGGGNFGFNEVYSLYWESERNLIEQNKFAGLLDEMGFLVISDNGCGDYYGFQVENNICSSRVDMWDHEENRIGNLSKGYSNLYEFLAVIALKS